MGFVARGLAVHALEPSAEMARAARKGSTRRRDAVRRMAYPSRRVPVGVRRAGVALGARGRIATTRRRGARTPGGTIAVFWNVGRAHPEPFKTDNDAAYERLAPELTDSVGDQWNPEVLVGDSAACGKFEPMVERKVTWRTSYTSAEWMRLLGTHSGHRMLPDDVRTRLHAEIGAVIDAHGGLLPVVYDTLIFLAQACNWRLAQPARQCFRAAPDGTSRRADTASGTSHCWVTPVGDTRSSPRRMNRNPYFGLDRHRLGHQLLDVDRHAVVAGVQRAGTRARTPRRPRPRRPARSRVRARSPRRGTARSTRSNPSRS